jgi:DNA-directed RNA polymerase specialized sigma24 family protein
VGTATRLTPADARDLEAAFSIHMPWLRRRIALMVGDPEEASDHLTCKTIRLLVRAWQFMARPG